MVLHIDVLFYNFTYMHHKTPFSIDFYCFKTWQCVHHPTPFPFHKVVKTETEAACRDLSSFTRNGSKCENIKMQKFNKKAVWLWQPHPTGSYFTMGRNINPFSSHTPKYPWSALSNTQRCFNQKGHWITIRGSFVPMLIFVTNSSTNFANTAFYSSFSLFSIIFYCCPFISMVFHGFPLFSIVFPSILSSAHTKMSRITLF